jgi:hypothetical protein
MLGQATQRNTRKGEQGPPSKIVYQYYFVVCTNDISKGIRQDKNNLIYKSLNYFGPNTMPHKLLMI